MECREVERYVDTFIDFEFAEPERLEVEAHLLSCPPCRRLVQERSAEKTSLRVAAPRPSASMALRQRIERVLEEEDQGAAHKPVSVPVLPKRFPSRWALPVLFLALPLYLFLSHRPLSPPAIADSIVRHQRNLPAEVSGDPRVVLRWFDGKVPFAVRALRLEPMASLRGGRISSIGNREAAYLIYDSHGDSHGDGQSGKISVFIFDPDEVAMVTGRRQMIHSHEVYLQGEKGYHVALFRDQGLGYAIAGDLDEPDLIRLIASAVSGR